MIAATAKQPCAQKAVDRWKADGSTQATFIEDNGPPIRWVVVSRSPPSGLDEFVLVVSSQEAATQERLLDVDTLIWLFVIGTPFLMAIGLASRFVSKAQGQIDAQTWSLQEARACVASFVSHSTRKRALSSSSSARRADATLLFLDVRDFSSFVEHSSPDETAELVSKIAGVTFTAVIAAGGDVDRLVGDGLLAWFEGDDRREHAWTAAEAVLLHLAQADLPRGGEAPSTSRHVAAVRQRRARP